ncbi:hypothetical protein ARALYDRAFT_470241 [Arabidopsis lyrata subsp. lyrata]|uniref:60S ribosomal protein L22 n=1 Tax=Arabidopsis lyrata subsp. lyrata TaxID=81972 RepID=D7KBC6_ARALL|nr:hypothetical protein ARALYDRAFT_470241 [Arabidopsis lyrata subsp. lyrata]
MARGIAAKSSGGAKKKGVSFVIDCSKPVDDTIMEIATLEKFLQERIKVGGKAGSLGNSVSITRDNVKITVNADSNFSKRSTISVIASNKDKNVYEVRYFRIDDEVASAEED